MGLYEGIKDVASVIQKADNIELYRQLIELSSQALDMQNEINRLSSENAELKRTQEIQSRIERHSEPYITLLDDDLESILYCSHCWDYEQKLIQIRCYDSGSFKCTHCENHGIYDIAKHQIAKQNRKITIVERNKHLW